jgi:hypothetical protein
MDLTGTRLSKWQNWNYTVGVFGAGVFFGTGFLAGTALGFGTDFLAGALLTTGDWNFFSIAL